MYNYNLRVAWADSNAIIIIFKRKTKTNFAFMRLAGEEKKQRSFFFRVWTFFFVWLFFEVARAHTHDLDARLMFTQRRALTKPWALSHTHTHHTSEVKKKQTVQKLEIGKKSK